MIAISEKKAAAFLLGCLWQTSFLNHFQPITYHAWLIIIFIIGHQFKLLYLLKASSTTFKMRIAQNLHSYWFLFFTFQTDCRCHIPRKAYHSLITERFTCKSFSKPNPCPSLILVQILLTLQFLSSLTPHMQIYLSSHQQKTTKQNKLTEQTLLRNCVEPGSYNISAVAKRSDSGFTDTKIG